MKLKEADMIETKEQYEQIRDLKYPNARAATIHIRQLTRTIEALREVARGADCYHGYHGSANESGVLTVETCQICRALDALPDWIIED